MVLIFLFVFFGGLDSTSVFSPFFFRSVLGSRATWGDGVRRSLKSPSVVWSFDKRFRGLRIHDSLPVVHLQSKVWLSHVTNTTFYFIHATLFLFFLFYIKFKQSQVFLILCLFRYFILIYSVIVSDWWIGVYGGLKIHPFLYKKKEGNNLSLC